MNMSVPCISEGSGNRTVTLHSIENCAIFLDRDFEEKSLEKEIFGGTV